MVAHSVLLVVLVMLSVGNGTQAQLSTVQFNQQFYYVEMPEEQPNGAQVVNVEAFYFSSTGRRFMDGQFSIPSDGDAQFFTIETTSARTTSVGIIRTAAVLDRDAPNAMTMFDFEVTYTAPDGATGSTEVSIQLTDVNDNAPRFSEEEFIVNLFEQTPGGTAFFNVTATDIDQLIVESVQEEISPNVFDLVERYTVTNGRIVFTIISGNELNHFTINEDNGTLSISPGVTLDVDLIDAYNLTVVATDGGGLNNTAMVLINVLDSNDNAPQILEPLGLDLSLSEDTEVGYVILDSINATDEDSGPNSDIRFLILSGDITNSFTVDERTGKIVISSSLDRERGAIVNLTVAARDRGVPLPLQNTILVVVRLTDVNDYTPTFAQDFYSFTVNENSRLNTRVAQLTATDLDEGTNGTLTFSIISEDDVFYIDPSSGEIFTNDSLDREEVAVYSFLVEVVDNPENSSLQLSSIANVTVLIGDLNDNPPIFDQRFYEMSILDNVSRDDLIIQVRATDRDSGSNGNIVYSIFEQDFGNPNALRVNSETGVVFRFRRIRFEDQSVFRVTIRATDGGGIHDSVPLTVYVHNVNENPPTFEQTFYNTTIFETTPVGTVVLNVSAPDLDMGLIGEVRYRVISEFDEAGSFEVNETTGDVYVNTTLDFDFRDFVYFQIEAYDGGFPQPFTDVTNVTVYLLGENDEAPSIIFPNGFRPTVPENEEPGIEIVNLTAFTFDPDFDEGGEFALYLVDIFDEVSVNDSFSFNETTGILTSLRTFDRESQPGGIIIAIETIDFGTPQQSKVTNITIFIGDKNDRAPYFESNVSTTTYEFMPVGTLVLDDYIALDEDIGTNAQLEYAIFDGEGSERFMINASTGHLFTAEVLDKNVQKFYNLTILVMDSGIPQMFGFGAIYIEVLDSNDMIPMFTEQVYTANFSESDPVGTFVLQVNATDMDIGTNAQLEYYIAPNSSNASRFFLNSTTGELFTDNIFDREVEGPFNLSIIAVDNGLVPSPLTGSATVLVTLLDENDNPPFFNESLYLAEVIENAANETYLAAVLAFDDDAESPNNVVRYSLQGNRSEDFYIDPISGDVIVAGEVDWEEGGVFSLVVVATDMGEPSQSAEAELMVTIEDVNDQYPIFVPESLNLTILENSLPGNTTEVGYVVAIDRDSEGNSSTVTYAVLMDFANNKFELDSETGLVTFVKGTLDRERRSRFDLFIRATDQGTTPLFTDATLIISVGDSNDFDPVFEQELFTGSVPEAAEMGTPILYVSATDRDTGTNADLIYSIPDPSLARYFAINETTGEIYTSGQELDFETANNVYTFEVVVRDSALLSRSSTAQVRIHITDSNDHAPVFVQNQYSALIRENLAPGTTVLRVIASDVDLELNAVIRYSIRMTTNSDVFGIDPETGVLYADRYINREETPFFNLTVVANNSVADAPLLSEVPVDILVTDLNDMHPSFEPIINVHVSEDEPANVTFYSLVAEDGDEGINGSVSYALLQGNEEGFFELDPFSGNLSLLQRLNFEETTFYMLAARAVDSGSPSLTGFTNILVQVINTNDHPPQFVNMDYFLTVRENAARGVSLATVVAFDRDQDSISYRLSDTSIFNIGSTSGVIQHVAPSLIPYAGTTQNITLEASDQNYTTTAQLVIYVQPGSSSSLPSFTQRQYSASLREDEVVGEILFEFSGETTNDDSYSIVSGDPDGLFSISGMGTLTLVSTVGLDYETQTLYQLVISIANSAGEQAFSLIDISVTDVNEHAPQFISQSFFVAVPETTPTGIGFFAVMATDLDGASPARDITYAITSTDPQITSRFRINSQTGELRLTRPLSFETGSPNFMLTVSATNQVTTPQLSSEITVEIEVLNGNSFDPVFDERTYFVELTERPSLDSLVGINIVNVSATDRDLGSSGVITYGLNGDHRYLDFRIDTFTGEIFINAEIDFERHNLYTLEAVASDGGNPNRIAVASVRIQILDLNDNSPIWEQDQYSAIVIENATIGSFVIQISASDADQVDSAIVGGELIFYNRNGYVTYSIMQGDPDDHFDIDPDTGIVSIASNLDRELYTDYNLTLNATDGGGIFANSYLDITVVDVNDEAPIFSESPYITGLPEDAENGTHVITVSATDTDLNQNSDFLYSFADSEFELLDSSVTYFINDTTGEIFLEQLIDREDISIYNLTVIAIDMGAIPLTGYVSVLVNILDINEFPPEFTLGEFFGQIHENEPRGTFIFSINSTDEDFGENSTVQYYITAGNELGLFDIVASTGDIVVGNPIDFEVGEMYNLVVMATDSGPMETRLTNETNVTIAILDRNDNPPLFTDPSYITSIPEDSNPGDFVLSVNATDADSGINAQFEFTLDFLGDTETESNFIIDSLSGEISLSSTRSLNRERITSYNFVVNVTDLGSPSLSSSVPVTVEIADVNDNVPQFTAPYFEGSLDENLLPGTPITNVSGTDEDIQLNAEILYSILAAAQSPEQCISLCGSQIFCVGLPLPNSNLALPFTIGPRSGIVSTLAPLDREATSRYVLIVEARDSAVNETQLSNTTCVHIVVLDVNDEYPTFSQNVYAANISEFAQSGEMVVQVFAQDDDLSSNAVVTYSLASEVGSFTIHPTRGEIFTLSNSFDREMRESYDIIVVAMDGGDSPLSSNATITVTILDENDSPPVFSESQYSASVFENLPTGTPVLRVNASDMDIGSNAAIIFSIVTSSPANHFEVDQSSGIVSITRPLDRESIDTYVLTLAATDGGFPQNTATSEVTVEVLDANDHHPLFTGTPFMGRVIENTAVNDQILTITADDRDIGSNAEVFFTIADVLPSSTAFVVNGTSGELYLLGTVDAEYSLEYTIEIVASNDAAVPVLSSKINITMTVGDLNDNTPIFGQRDYNIPYSEANPIGSRVIQLVVVDNDATIANSELTFEISGGFNTSLFSINASSGVVSVADTLDREDEPVHVLEITVSDSGSPPLNSTTTLMIILVDFNDNRPIFEQSFYTFSVAENIPMATSVGRVQANDLDLQEVSYFSPDSVYFIVDSTSGEILTASGELDREMQELYSFTIVATDGDLAMERTSQVMVNVTLLDLNDVTPAFSNGTYQVAWKEDTPVGSLLLTVEATDFDLLENGTLQYYILMGNDSYFFSVNITSGEILLERGFDRETQDLFSLTVTAEDLGEPGLTGTTNVIISVLDVNDNIPQLNMTDYFTMLDEDTRVGTQIVFTGAEDQDIDENSNITFSLSDDFNGTFVIGEKSGIIVLSRSLDYEISPSYTFSVIAEDDGAPSLSNSSQVFVEVIDLNDNPPIFDSDIYRVSIPENSILSSLVFLANATDADSTSNGELRYSILGGNFRSVFSIDEAFGGIVLADYLDREITSEYSLSLRVVDQGTPQFTARTELEVTILDVNDHPPQFSSKIYSVSISESSGIGMEFFTAIATDQDIGRNADLSYSIISGDDNETFVIDSFTGRVRVARPLDFETIPIYSLILRVTDNGETVQLTDTASLTVSVNDVNEYPPFFPADTYYLNVSDNEVVGASLGYFTAVDGDVYSDNQITYSLINGGSLFGVDVLEGTLFVRSPLIPGSYELTLEATDGVHITSVTVHVTVVPLSAAAMLELFQPASFLFEISESAPNGSIIGDTNVPGAAIVQSFSPNRFDIDSEGQVILTGDLDHESMDAFVMNVVNYGENYTSVFSVMTIVVQDINDNPPQFASEEYFLTISELVEVGSSVLQLGAYDADTLRENTEFQFIVTSEERGRMDDFFLDPSTGVLIVAQPLDYENQNMYILTVNVTNHLASPMLQSSTLIYIELQDENDNDPQFSETFYRTQVLESSPVGTEILILEASDADSGSNADLVFSILHINVPLLFKINETSGSITTNSTFDVGMDITSSYIISAAVSDRGSPQPRIDTTIIFVEVLPDNMYPPEFIPPEGYAVSVPETISVGETVLQISAYDPDFPNDTQSVVTFSIISGDNEGKFEIDPSTGLISLVSSIDFDEEPVYVLTVQAADFGSPSLTSFARVNVTVQDINNHDPEFDSPAYEFPIFENIAIGTRLFQISATDPDTLDITYQITVNAYDENVTALFSINSTTGYIFTAGHIDREFADKLEILVSAIDSGYPTLRSSSQIVTFPVLDLNDNPPTFNQSELIVPVLRLLGPSQFAAIVPATDADIVSQANLDYRILEDGSNGLFVMNSTTGQLITTGRVPESPSTYTLVVNVFDGVFDSNVSVMIQLINDGDFCNDVGFCTSVREVNCTFDIFPFVECNPYCLGQYSLSPERRVCITYSCEDSSLVPCVALTECLPPDMACAGVCPQGMAVCTTTNICHETSLSESCDLSNVTCLIGQTLVQRPSGSRYCTNSSLLPSVGETCTDLGLVYCEALDECHNVSISLVCQPCPDGLFYCESNGSCLASLTECCEENSYYCHVLGECIETGMECRLRNFAPEITSKLIHLESLLTFELDSANASLGYVIAQLLGNGTHPAVDSQGEQVSIAIAQLSPVSANLGEWQYSLCAEYDLTCLSLSTSWLSINGDMLSEENALVLPNVARVRFVPRSFELAGAVWLRVKLWDGNKDGFISPSDNLVSLSSPQFLTTLPYTENGAFSANTTLLTILVHPYIQPPVFNSQASFRFTNIVEDTAFAYNYGNTVSDVVASVHVQYLSPLPEGIVHGFSSLPEGADIEQLLPLKARENYIRDVDRANPVRRERQAASLSGQLPGVAISLNGSTPGRWQVSLRGDTKRFIGISSLIEPSTQLLLLNTTARLRFLPDTNFCGSVPILLGAWDGFWDNSVARLLDSGYIVSSLPSASSSLSHYNLNEWEEASINVACVPDKPVIRVERVLLDPIPYRLAYRYERLFTALVARDFASVRQEKDTLENYLQLILRVPVIIKRISKALDVWSYVTFAVDADVLNFTQVNRLLVERQSVLAALDFNLLELSQDASYGPGDGCSGDDPLHYHGVHIDSFISRFAFDGDDDFLGMAVVGVSTPSQGMWQYHRGNWLVNEDLSSEYNSNSSIWVNFPPSTVISETASFILHGNDRIRFTPTPTYFWENSSTTNTNVPSLRVKLWDLTVGNLSRLNEISTMNINTSPFEDTLQSLTSPYGLFSDGVMIIEASRLGCDGVANSALVHDTCCVCGGRGEACDGCDGVRGSNVQYDSCDECGGQSACLGCDSIPFSGMEPGLCSDCISSISITTGDPSPSQIYPSSTFRDCTSRCYGDTLTDSCGICSGGSTGHVYNSDRDCAGVCFGGAARDDCGDCTGPNTILSYNQNVDCTGVCHGRYQTDSCGVCQEPDLNGGIFENRDCNGTCFGEAALDNCDLCFGGETGVVMDSTRDACGVCDGDNSTCIGCNGEVASGVMVDTCGDCGGNGCGCFKIDSITPNAGPRTGGTEVIISGAGLFLNDSAALGFTFDRNVPNCGAPYRFPVTEASIRITCLFRGVNSGEQRQAFAIPINQTTVRCITESTTLESREFLVQVRVANGPFSNPIPFFYDDYSVINVNYLYPTSALIGDSSATIHFIGANFLNSLAAACLIYNFQTCDIETLSRAEPYSIPALFVNGSQYSCQLPEALVPCRVVIRLSLDGQESGNLESLSTDFSFTYRQSSPRVSDVFFARDLSNLIVEFDRSVRLADSATITCYNAFNQETFNLIGGLNATCDWTDNRQRGITISLPSSANVVVNSSVLFKNGAVETNGSQFSFAISNTTLQFVSERNAIRPIAVIDGPSSIPICGEFTLSAVHSQFPGYKDFEYQWSISVEDIATVDNFDLVLDYFDNLETDANSITLDSTPFLQNVVYFIQLSVLNSAGIKSEIETLNLTKYTTVQPQLHIIGQEELQIYYGEDLTLEARVFLPVCFSGNGQNVFVYTWQLMRVVDQRRNTLVEENVPTVHTLSPLVTFPSGLFEPNTSYTIHLTATVNTQRTNTDVVALRVLSTDVCAVIVGGNRTVAQHREIILDARNSTISPFLDSPKFTWACDILGSQDACYNRSNSSYPVPILIPNTDFVAIPAGDLDPGRFYRFSLTLEQADRVSKSSVVIETVPSSAPIVEIINNKDIVLFTQEVWLEGVVYSSLPLERAYWESIQLSQGFLNLEDSSFFQSQTVYPSADTPTTTSSTATSSSPVTMVTTNQANHVNLVIPPHHLVPGLTYTFRLTAAGRNGDSTYAEISITATAPPQLVQLETTPTYGVAMETLYILTTSGGVANPMDTPLLYQFGFLKFGQKDDLSNPLSDGDVQWISGVQISTSISTLLPSGDPARNYSLTLIVRTFDREGSFSDSTVDVVVMSQDVGSSTVQYYSRVLSGLQRSLSDAKEWSAVLSQLTSAITEINKYEHLRSSNLKAQSLQLFLDIFSNHLFPSGAHYKLAATLLEQITVYGGISTPGDQRRIVAAVNVIVEWFRSETSLKLTSTAPVPMQASREPLLLRTTYQSSAPPLFSESTATTLIDIYLNMVEGGAPTDVQESFIQTLEKVNKVLCQESTTGKRASTINTRVAKVFTKTAIPSGMFNISGVLVNFMDSVSTLYQSTACPSMATPCLETCFSGVVLSNSSGLLTTTVTTNSDGSLILDVQSQQKLVSEIEGSNPRAIKLFSDILSVVISIPVQQTYLQIQNLNTPIQILIPVLNPISDQESQPLCLYRELGGAGGFETEDYLWKIDVTASPEITMIGSKTYYICEYYHLSEFAIGLLPPPVITEPPPTTTPPPPTPPPTVATTSPPQTTAETSSEPVAFPAAAVVIPLLLILVLVAVTIVLVIVFVWKNKRRGKMQIAPMDSPKQEEKEPKAKLVKAGPLTPEESKVPMQVIMCKGDGKERSRVGTLNVLPSIRLRELRYQLSDNFPSLKEKSFYFLTRQLCDIEPAAEQQQFVSLVFGGKPIFVREVGGETDQTKKHFCICGNAAVFECSNCSSQGYCSPECQTKHWSEQHQKECTKLSEKRKRSDILQRRLSVGEESQKRLSIGSNAPLSSTTPGSSTMPGQPPVRKVSFNSPRVSLSTLANQPSSATNGEREAESIRSPASLDPLTRVPANLALTQRRQLAPLSRSGNLQQYNQQPGFQQQGGFITPQESGRSSIVTSTPFPGQNVSSLPFTPGRGSLQSPLRTPQPLFTQPTAIRQFSTRPLATSRQINVRHEPLQESDEDDYDSSSSDGSETKSPAHSARTKQDKSKTVATPPVREVIVTPSPSAGGEEPSTSRPPSLSVRKKRGSASQQSQKTLESSSSTSSGSSMSGSESGSSGSESSSEDEEREN